MKVPRLAYLAVLALLLCASAAQALPRVTLKVEDATLHDVLRQVRNQTGWTLIGPNTEGEEGYRPPPTAGRARFAWTDAGLGRVCREVGQAYGLRPVHQGGNLVLFRAEPFPAAPPPGSFTRGGAVFTPGKVSQDQREVVAPGKPQPPRPFLLPLTVRAPDGDPDTLYSLDNLRALDNLGREIILPRPAVVWDGAIATGGPPDEWRPVLDLGVLDSRIRKLTLLDGELVLFRHVRTERVEMPLSSSTPYTRKLPDVDLTVSHVQAAGPQSYIVHFQAAWAADTVVSTAHGSPFWPYPGVRLQSGKIVRWRPRSLSRSTSAERQIAAMEGTCDGIPTDPPVALVWDFLIKSSPDRRVAFRLQNIAIRGDAGVALAAGMGGISSTVHGEGDRPGGGLVALGLARKAGAGWGPVRWHLRETDDAGAVVLENVEPGEYRVFRTFNPRNPHGDPENLSARWDRTPLEVQVQAGKVVALPPLKRVP